MSKWNIQLDNLLGLLLLLTGSLISGCTSPLFGGYGAEGRTREEFARYVEEVFKLQNHVTSQMMILMENGDINSQQSITKAEQHMQEKCSPINEYASRDIDGLNISFTLRRQVEKSAEDCDKAAHELKSLLSNY
jgi:hypothetical protein